MARLRERGVSTILVEQRVDAVLSVADRVSFIENGRLNRRPSMSSSCATTTRW